MFMFFLYTHKMKISTREIPTENGDCVGRPVVLAAAGLATVAGLALGDGREGDDESTRHEFEYEPAGLSPMLMLRAVPHYTRARVGSADVRRACALRAPPCFLLGHVCSREPPLLIQCAVSTATDD